MNDLTTPSAAGRERIKHTFDALKLNHQVALIPYLMAGFPKPEMTVTEGAPVRTRKKRATNGGTSPARTPGEAFFGKGPDGAG